MKLGVWGRAVDKATLTASFRAHVSIASNHHHHHHHHHQPAAVNLGSKD